MCAAAALTGRCHPSPRRAEDRRSAPPSRPQPLVGDRREVAGPEREDDVTRAGEARARAGRRRRAAGGTRRRLGVRVEHRSQHEPSRDSGAGELSRRVDVGQDEHVGVDERVGEVAPEASRCGCSGAAGTPRPRGATRLRARRASTARTSAGRWRVVVDERDAVDLAAELEAAGDAAEPAERTDDGRERHAELERERSRPGGVQRVVPTGHRELDRRRARRRRARA